MKDTQTHNADLISRSALLKALDKLYMAALRKTAHSVETIYELDHLAMLVKEAPAVDAEPVRHGRLYQKRISVPKGKGQTYLVWACSLCHKHEKKRSDYCPNCGAKMDAEVEG